MEREPSYPDRAEIDALWRAFGETATAELEQVLERAHAGATKCRNRIASIAGAAPHIIPGDRFPAGLVGDIPLRRHLELVGAATDTLLRLVTELSELDECPPELDSRQLIGEACRALGQLAGGVAANHPASSVQQADELLTAVRRIRARLRLSEPATPETYHSDDFSFVRWFGTEYRFGPRQAQIVSLLWNEYEKGGGSLLQTTIGEHVDNAADNFRIDASFRNHPAYGTMIRRVAKGTFALVEP